jgi:hypothetical protein
MHRKCSVLAIISALAAGAPGCGPSGPARPPDDVCGPPEDGRVDALELGAAGGDELRGDPGPFSPLADGDGVSLVRGGQGAFMVGWRLRLTGGAVPDCLLQDLGIANTPDGGDPVRWSKTVRTYVELDGTRTTHPMWVPGYYALPFRVTVTAGGQTLTRDLHPN